MTIYPIANRFETNLPNLVTNTSFIVFADKAEMDAYILTLVTADVAHVYTVATVGSDIIVYDNGVEDKREVFNDKHPLWDLDFSNIDIAAQQAIHRHFGVKIGLSGILQKLSQAKTYIDNKKPEYPSGIGGAVTQLTNKSTPVTLNTIYGRITTHNAALAAGAEVVFRVNNSLVGATDIIIPNIQSGGTAGSYMICIGAKTAGSFDVVLSNVSTGSLSQAIVIDFCIIRLI